VFNFADLKKGDTFKFPGVQDHEVLGTIAGSYNRLVLRVKGNGHDGGGDSSVFKIAAAHEGHVDDFRGKCEEIHGYQQMLKVLGVRTPDPITTHETVMNGRHFLLEISPFTGQTVHDVMTTASETEALTLSQGMADTALRPILSQETRGDGNLRCGVDMIPRNFTRDGAGKLHYVDLWPPKLWLNGEPALEYPEPVDSEVIDLGIFRHFTHFGVTQAFLVQLCRIRPDLRRKFQDLIDQFLGSIEMPTTRKQMLASPACRFQNGEPLDRVLAPLDSREIYDLRELACELTFQGRLIPSDLEQIFQDSHFQDTPLPGDLIDQIKEALCAANATGELTM